MQKHSWKSIKTFIIYFALFFISCSKDQKKFVESNVGPEIVIMGSSTAEGVGANPRDSSWANKFRNQLVKDFGNAKVINLAMAGYTTFHILPSDYTSADVNRNVDKALAHSPKLIMISLPSNDFANGYHDEEILNNYKIIIKKITDAQCEFIIFSTQPRNFQSLEKRKGLALFNYKLESLYPDHVLHIYDKLATHEYYIKPIYSNGDGVHLNNSGHDLIFHSLINNEILKKAFYF